MSDWYYLKHRKPVPYGFDILTDTEKWVKLNTKYYSKSVKIRCTFINGIQISTIFLGLDHSFCDNDIKLFETMIFGGTQDRFTYRCSTHRQALKQHWQAVKIAQIRVVK